jgi:hypothetical protein
VDRGEFLRVWDASFDWEMMTYPLLTRVAGGRQLFLNKNRLQVRTQSSVERGEIDPQSLVERISREFGVAPQVTAKALVILNRKGVRHGGAATP